MSNEWDEDTLPEGVPRCRICHRAADGELCADCEWHLRDDDGSAARVRSDRQEHEMCKPLKPHWSQGYLCVHIPSGQLMVVERWHRATNTFVVQRSDYPDGLKFAPEQVRWPTSAEQYYWRVGESVYENPELSPNT